MTGLAGWMTWLFVHLAFLTGFRNRLAAVASWAGAFLGRDGCRPTAPGQAPRKYARQRR
jgi:NADH dehydrogenase FAD-containing subunit